MTELEKHECIPAHERLSKGYWQDIQVFNRFAAGRPLCRELIQEYFLEKTKVYKAATLQRHRSALKSALRLSRGNGITLEEIVQIDTFFREIKTGKPAVEKLRDEMLTVREIKKICKKCGPKTEVIICALYQMACRVSELINIKITDCEIIETGVKIRIRHGKGEKERFVYMRLETYNQIGRLYKGREYLFEYELRPLSRFTICNMIKRAGKKIGKNISPHILRHSWASNRINELGIASVSEYLGHSDKSTTAKYYLHAKPLIAEVLKDGV